MEDRKYILTDETIKFDGHTLHRIKAVKDFCDIKKDELGGWVESEANLSQEDECWVYDEAKVFGKAKIYGNATVCDCVCVFDNAEVYENAEITYNARIYDNAEIFGNASINGDAEIYGDTEICGDVVVADYACIYGGVFICGNAEIGGDAVIKSNKDYAVYQNTWSSFRYFTWTRSNNKWRVGCFYGTGEELIKKAYEDSKVSGKCYKAIVKAQEVIMANVK